MAKEDKPNLVLRPEEKIAARLLKRAKMRPPVKIRKLASALADIERDDLPIDADALLLLPNERRDRPLIILDNSCKSVRARFTLAHELGHIAIPWHIGEVAFKLQNDLDGFFQHGQEEAEANRFASELLMPTDWVSSILAATPDVRDAVQKVQAAGVSIAAANWAVFKCAGPGSIVATVDRDQTILRVSRSVGTYASPPPLDTKIDPQCFGGVPIGHWEIKCGYRSFHWWRFSVAAIDQVEAVPRSAREVLEGILADLGIPGGANSREFGSLMAKTGHFRGKPELRSAVAGVFLAAFEQRFATEVDDVVKHPRFSEFLHARANELATK